MKCVEHRKDIIKIKRNNDYILTVSQICSLICLPSIFTMRAPNSTPIVRSWTGWKRLSVNCSSKHDLPTAAKQRQIVTEKLTYKYKQVHKLCVPNFVFPFHTKHYVIAYTTLILFMIIKLSHLAPEVRSNFS